MSKLRWVLPVVAACVPLSPLWAQDCSPREIGPDESKTASFAAGDCTLRGLIGGTRTEYAHPYNVTLPRDEILTADLKSAAADAYLYVYSLSGVRLTANDNVSAQSTDSRVTIALRQGTYVLIASTRGVTAGAYTLQTALGTLPPCPETEARLDAPMDGQLTRDSCRYMDVRAPSSDSSRAAPYRLTVPSPSVLTVKMSSKEFSPYLEILDSRFEYLSYADAEGDPEVELAISLEPGSYILLATTSETGPTGAYTLTAALAEPRSCGGRDIGLGETVEGRLAAGEDCRYLDLVWLSADTTPIDLYRVTISQRGVLSLSLSSTVFTPYLAVLDERGLELNSTIDDEEPGPTAQLATSLPPGVYHILVNTWDDAGAYKLMSNFSELRPCKIDDARPDEPMQGALMAQGCRILDLVAPSGDPAYAAGYRLPISDRRILTADQTSTQVDSALYLFGPNEMLLSFDDNGGGGKNSRVTTLLGPGTYRLAASSANGGTGSFTLSARLTEPPVCAIETIEPAATVSGQLASTDCRIRETVVGSTGGSYVRRYRVTLTQAGRLQLQVSSRTVATALVLTDAETKTVQIATTQLNGAARMEKRLEAGTYIVHVITMVSGQTGSFALQSTFEASQ
ncbi:MAG: hypothetical protein Q8N47_08250 [Bryobacterales bacterium]|nr:hypothetical protein [Bryobacterales bacterium]